MSKLSSIYPPDKPLKKYRRVEQRFYAEEVDPLIEKIQDLAKGFPNDVMDGNSDVSGAQADLLLAIHHLKIWKKLHIDECKSRRRNVS